MLKISFFQCCGSEYASIVCNIFGLIHLQNYRLDPAPGQNGYNPKNSFSNVKTFQLIDNKKTVTLN
jgi:hypothetical protein